jgi:hypothetical protein
LLCLGLSNFAAALTTQTITITQGVPPSAPYNSWFNLGATASSGLLVKMTSSGGCSVALGLGKYAAKITSSTIPCVIYYNQAGNATYAAAPQKISTTYVTKANQSISITKAAPTSAVYGVSFDVAATASSNLPVSISASNNCDISGNIVTPFAGSPANCLINYTQAGDDNYNAASAISSSVVVTEKTLFLDSNYTGSAVLESNNKQ